MAYRGGTLSYPGSWPDIPFLFPYGPMLAAVTAASITCGAAGLKDIMRRCLRWRVGLRWYAAALLLPVAIALATVASAAVTNWVYYNADESALLAILYHTAANTIGHLPLSRILWIRIGKAFWLLAAVNCVAAATAVLVAPGRVSRTCHRST